MSNRITSAAFATTLLAMYLTLGVPLLLLLPAERPLLWLALALLHECLALGIAIDFAELLFGWLLPPRVHPRLAEVDRSAIRVAALYVCCDDIDTESLASLRELRDVDVYILDDSVTASSRRQADGGGMRVLRREDRTAFKAGNLNHWLGRHGREYDYFVVLDSDSVMTPDAVWDLVAYAEAPENRDVAIVQSSILPRGGNCFQRYASIHVPVRNRILSRLHDAIGWTLSHGHNNLHRTAAIRALEGFDTTATCEDTTTSLHLLRDGWRIILVETASHDAEPRDIVAFRRRHVRWARQTVEAVGALKLQAGLAPVLLMVRHVLAYLLPIAGTVSLALFLTGKTSRGPLPGIPSLGPEAARLLGSVVVFALSGSLVAIALLRVLHCVLARQRLRALFLSSLLNSAAVAFCCAQTALGLLRSLLHRRVVFTPTGAARRLSPTFRHLLQSMSWTWIVWLAVAAMAARQPFLEAGLLKVFWLVCFTGSPLLLWFFHRDQTEEGGRS